MSHEIERLSCTLTLNLLILGGAPGPGDISEVVIYVMHELMCYLINTVMLAIGLVVLPPLNCDGGCLPSITQYI